MSQKVFKYIYGPVPSRRLGRSLGLDLAPCKTCSYDCIYCQLGKTTHKTIERSNYVDAAEVLSELKEKLTRGVRCDYISLAGSGEPTLYAPLGELIARIREMEARNRFHVIIGSFKVPSNADDYQREVSTLGFQNPKIVESPNGFRMVSVGAFDTYLRAANEILRINRGKEEPIELWVYEAR